MKCEMGDMRYGMCDMRYGMGDLGSQIAYHISHKP